MERVLGLKGHSEMIALIGNLKPKLGIGFCMGGRLSGANYGNTTVDGFSFVTLVAISVGGVLSVARYDVTGAQTVAKAYCFGGIDSGLLKNEIDGFIMLTGAGINPSVVLSESKNALAAAQDTINAVIFAGYTTAPLNSIEGMVLSTETMYAPTAVLSVSGYYAIAFNNRYGSPYINSIVMAGNTSTSTVYKIVTSDGTTTNKGGMLEPASWGATGINSDCKGYHITGIVSSTATTAIDSFIYATETAANPSVVAVVATRNAAGANSLIYGIVIGGELTSGGTSNKIDGIHFPTETQYNPSAVIGVARYGAAGAQSGGYL